MKTPPQISVEQLIEYGEMLIDDGQPDAARKFFLKAIEREPNNIDALLLLSGTCERGEDSLRYLARVLDIDPKNERARAGIRWARKRVTNTVSGGLAQADTAPPPAPAEPDRTAQPKSQKGSGASPAASILLGSLIGLILIVCVVIGGLWLFGPPQNAIAQIAPAIIAPTTATATLAPTATNTPSPTATAVPTFAPTNTTEPVQIVESTAVPTEFPTAQPTDEPTIEPTATPTDFPTAEPPVAPTLEPVATPADPGPVNTTRWIDVDLTNQVLMAYEGDNVVRSVLVSTGLPGSPTVTGQYNIYVKYPAQLMYGPGYYLPDVPWVMYFYQGYGLHGTSWHHNFGHPMSHGCVNMPTPDAEWLYNWASVGTLVNIHY